MKNLLLLVALSLAPGASLQVWAQNPIPVPQTVPDAAPNVAAPDLTPFHWRLHLTAGQKFLTKNETSTQTLQQLPKAPDAAQTQPPMIIENNVKTLLVIEQNVLSSDDKGARIEMVYREMKQSSVMRQGDKILSDSANPPAALKGMADIFKVIEGARLSYQLSPSGEISDIRGVEEFLAKMEAGIAKALSASPEAAAMQKMMGDTLKATTSPETLKNSMDASYRTMPTKAVAPGESWVYTLAMPLMGTTFTQNGKTTFVARAAGVITLAQTGDFSTDAGANFKIPLPASQDKNAPAPVTQLDLTGTSTGEILVDEDSGMPLKNSVEQTMEGEIVMSGLTGRGSVLSIPMKMKSQTLITTQEVKPEAVKLEAAKTEAVKTEAVKTEAVKLEAAKTEVVKPNN